MFQFTGFPRIHYLFMYTYMLSQHVSSLIRISAVQSSFASSPQLFAACHVLLRRLVPRHPPYALCSLIIFSFFSLSIAVFYVKNTSFPASISSKLSCLLPSPRFLCILLLLLFRQSLVVNEQLSFRIQLTENCTAEESSSSSQLRCLLSLEAFSSSNIFPDSAH